MIINTLFRHSLTLNVLRLDIERMLLIPMKMKDQTMIYLAYGTAARRTW